MKFRVQPGGNLIGTVRVPGDKSISHRSVMLGSLAEGKTRVSGFLQGEDALATVGCISIYGGLKLNGPDNGEMIINGVGLKGLNAPRAPIDIGNSGHEYTFVVWHIGRAIV